ncbi:RHS repeat-associated protein [Tenacibaculum skagerrakense]|uniref:RHS repeat-associated protein n=1 Tax=Tenacibaculum skagerrakense TaxID=186571 RepID=A0A4R2NUC3_9FLAO|nr:DUF6443 domain-containing protein [Tenacibaculum skagerrakense]TCP25151.1 RHS repeat-associated protein [Tenacibaculum skagerrakense]
MNYLSSRFCLAQTLTLLYFLFSVTVATFSQSNENYIKLTEYNSATSNSVPEHLILNEPVSNIHYSASQSITLEPGFYATSNVTLKIGSSNLLPNQESITYFDGLGKPIQQIAIGQSPDGKDIIQHIEYDEFGRISKQFLPHEYTGGTPGTYRTNAEWTTKTYYKDNYPEDFLGITDISLINPYSQKTYELSPLNRVEKQSSPGELFNMGSGHELKFEHKVNSSNEVRKYTINSDGTLGGGSLFFDEGELIKNVTKGQNWKPSDNKNYTTEEFRDKLGKIILRRVYNDNEPHDTYFVYDYLDNLKYVLPPKLVDAYSNTIYSNYSNNWSLNDFLQEGSTSSSLSFEIINDNISINGTISSTNFSSFRLNPSTSKNINSNTTIPNMSLGVIRGHVGWHSLTVSPIYEDIGEIKIENGNLVINRTNDKSFFSATINVSHALSNSSAIPQEVLNNLAYQYKYDEWNRLIEKKLPEKQWEYIIYDSHDKPILTQDGSLRGENFWAFTKYDTYGRTVYTGLYSSSKTRSNLQLEVDNYINASNKNNSESRITSTKIIGQVALNYDNKAFPTTNITEVLAVNYYDDYSFSDSDKPSIPTDVLNQTVTTRTNGLVTSSWIKTLNQNTWSKAYTFYDEKARELRVYSKNHLGGYTMVDSQINFGGTINKTVSTHKKTASDALVTIIDEFEYDNALRLKKQTQQINNAPKETIVANNYDGTGMLLQKKVGGANTSLQTLDYKYNVRGALTDINDVNSDLSTTPDNDVFAFKLNYENPLEGTANVPQLFNGNVTQTIWKNSIENDKQSYTYNYDALSRITRANYRKGSSLSTDAEKFGLSNVTYDKGGNINTLQRSGTNGQIDNLTYSYEIIDEQTTNKLVDITDTTNNPEGYKDTNATGENYVYDSNGRLIADKNKGVTNIRYNYLDLPTEITFSNGNKIEVTYDASGNKLEKLFITSSGNTKTLYVNGFQYQNNQLQFFGHSEGYAYKEGTQFKYAYVYNDHLGNNRLSYADVDGNGTIDNNEILTKTDYYPFGLTHEGEYISSSGSNYNYKYQGKELQLENNLQQYDFGSRIYDGATGRWFVVDPQAEQFYGMSPYLAMGNNPIIIVDPDGEWIHILVGAVIGGVVNVVSNWDNIESFGDGLAYFGVGAASGAVTAATGNPALGGALLGLGNGLYQGQSGMQLVQSTIAGGVISGVGAGLGKLVSPLVGKLGVNKLTQNITNTYLKNAINYGVNNAITGSVVGGTLSVATGGNFYDGAKQGFAYGLGTGIAGGLYQGHKEFKLNKAREIELALEKELKTNHKNKLILLPERKTGHMKPWNEMTLKEQGKLRHTYDRKQKEFGLPNFRASKGAHHQKILNDKIAEVRNAGTKQGFFRSTEWVNGQMTPVNRSNPIINGVRHYYYETLDGKFVSFGIMK